MLNKEVTIQNIIKLTVRRNAPLIILIMPYNLIILLIIIILIINFNIEISIIHILLDWPKMTEMYR